MNRFLQIFFSILKLVSLPIINFVTLFFGIKFYGKENWGEFLSIAIWIYFFAFVAKWSGQNYVIKEFSKNPSRIWTVFYSNLIDRSCLLIPSLLLFLFFPLTISLTAIGFLLLIFIYNSYDSIIVYKQKLELQFISEIIGFLILIIGFQLFPNFNLITVLNIFCLSFVIKILFLVSHFKLNLNKVNIVFSLQNLLQSYPYFLIGFSGWLASKCDVYLVSYMFTKKELSEYQMLMNCFLILQAVPAYFILPINKHLFRLSEMSISKIKSKILIISIPIISFATIAIWLFLNQIIQIKFSGLVYLFAALSTIPTFFYTIDIIQFYRKEKEKIVMHYSFFIVFLNVLLASILIPKFRILGIVISVCISQWLYLFLIIKENNK